MTRQSCRDWKKTDCGCLWHGIYGWYGTIIQSQLHMICMERCLPCWSAKHIISYYFLFDFVISWHCLINMSHIKYYILLTRICLCCWLQGITGKETRASWSDEDISSIYKYKNFIMITVHTQEKVVNCRSVWVRVDPTKRSTKLISSPMF